MIWTDLIEEFPEDGYIHPLHEGKGHDGRKYRPVWHAVESTKGMDYNIVTDGGEELESGVQRTSERPAFVDPLTEYVVCHFCGQTWEPTAVDGFDLSAEDEYYPKMVPVCPEHVGGCR